MQVEYETDLSYADLSRFNLEPYVINNNEKLDQLKVRSPLLKQHEEHNRSASEPPHQQQTKSANTKPKSFSPVYIFCKFVPQMTQKWKSKFCINHL